MKSRTIDRMVTARVPIQAGDYRLSLYCNGQDDKEHLALVRGEVAHRDGVLVRVHSECFTGDVLGSRRCDCGDQLRLALEKIDQDGCGVILYLRQEGRGIGLLQKLKAYNLQDQGHDTVAANRLLGHAPDERDYGLAALILEDLGVGSVRLLTNNPAKIRGLREHGIEVRDRIPMPAPVTAENAAYLRTKVEQLEHLLDVDALAPVEEPRTVASSPDTEPKAARRPARRVSVVFEAPRRVTLREGDVPRPGPGEVLVATEVSAVSPGTELLIYRGEAPSGLAVDETLPAFTGEFRFPLRYGYSAVGRVIETGPGVEDSWLERRVFAFHPHESHFTSSPDHLIPVPRGIPSEDAALLAGMETAVNFLMDGRPAIGEQVVVFGQGIVGLLTTALLAGLPLANLVTVDRYSRRRRASLEIGASVSLDPAAPDLSDRLAEALQDGRSQAGADLTYELSGSPAALDQALDATGFDGRLVIGSWYGSKRASLDLGGRFHRSRIRLQASQVSTLGSEWSGRWTKARRLRVAWQAMRRVRPSRWITHRLGVADAAESYELLDRRPEEAIQVVLRYDGASAAGGQLS